MSIAHYFFEHHIMLMELLGLWALLSIGVHISRKTINFTKLAIILIIIESVLWSVEEWTQTHDGYIMLRSMLTASIYCIHPVIVMTIIEMTAPVRRHKKLFVLPLVVYIPVIFTSQWTHIVYYISDTNHWTGTGHVLSSLPYIMFVGYTIIFFVLFINRYKKYNWNTMMAVILIAAASLVGLFVNYIKEISTDYATVFSSIIVLYYLFIYMLMSKTDYMTGLMNRQSFYHDSVHDIKKLSAVCLIDMNELKKINDSFGHKAGDDAIEKVAECFILGDVNSKRVYRIGGDEFAIIYEGKNESEVQEDIAMMNKALKDSNYSCAFGYCMINDGISFEKAMKKADKAMYKNKTEIKCAT